MKSQRPLDWLNFFLADVKDGLGPFLAIYLLSSRHWDPGEIGMVMRNRFVVSTKSGLGGTSGDIVPPRDFSLESIL